MWRDPGEILYLHKPEGSWMVDLFLDFSSWLRGLLFMLQTRIRSTVLTSDKADAKVKFP